MRVPEPPMAGKGSISLSLVLHALLVAAAGFLAAREGMLGEQFKEIAVTIVPKTKAPEPKVEPEPPKVQEPLPVESTPEAAPVAKDEVPSSEAPPAAVTEAPVLAQTVAVPPPAARISPAFVFRDGAKGPARAGDPISAYRSLIEYTLQSQWSCPRSVKERGLVTEVEVRVDSQGQVAVEGWRQLSGNRVWDDSVRKVFQQPPSVRRSPPAHFPEVVVVRFDMAERAVIGMR